MPASQARNDICVGDCSDDSVPLLLANQGSSLQITRPTKKPDHVNVFHRAFVQSDQNNFPKILLHQEHRKYIMV